MPHLNLTQNQLESLTTLNMMIFKTFNKLRRQLSNLTRLKPSEFVELCRKTYLLMEISLNEIILIFNNLGNKLMENTVKYVCHGYKDLVDIIIDYILNPDNFNMAFDAMSIREMHVKMQQNLKRMNLYKETALMDPEGFVEKMKKTREKLEIPGDYLYSGGDWSTLDEEDDMDIGGIRWSKRRAKQIEKEIKKVSKTKEQFEKEIEVQKKRKVDQEKQYKSTIAEVDYDIIERLVGLIDSGKILDFSDNKDYQVILALKDRLYRNMMEDHASQRKQIDDLLSFFEGLRISPGQTVNYLEDILHGMATTTDKAVIHDVSSGNFLDDEKFRRKLHFVESEMLTAFDEKQRKMVLRILIRYEKSRQKSMKDKACDPFVPWEQIVEKIEDDFKKNSELEARYKVKMKRIMDERDELSHVIDGLKTKLKATEDLAESYESNVHDLLNELNIKKQELSQAKKFLENKEFEVFKLEEMLRLGDHTPSRRNDDSNKIDVRIDDKLDRLVGIIQDLSEESRIYIDKKKNVVTDHPYVEKDMFGLRKDLNKAETHVKYARGEKWTRRIANNTKKLNNLNLKQEIPTKEVIKKRKKQ